MTQNQEGRALRDKLIASGFYAEKQLHSKFAVLSWSHSKRFEVAREMLIPYASGSLLDYGCGDGTLIAGNLDLFPRATGLDPDPKTISNLRERFAEIPNVNFIEKLTDEGPFDVICCLEVFEHCLPETQKRILRDLAENTKRNGHVLISVPIEVGIPLLIKQLGRHAASFLKIKHYQYMETYSLWMFLRALFATRNTVFERTVYAGGQIGHKGFNWRSFQKLVEEHFKISKIKFSPLHFLGAQFCSQVFFLCEGRN
jgi:SAM-dependent methyltransferase